MIKQLSDRVVNLELKLTNLEQVKYFNQFTLTEILTLLITLTLVIAAIAPVFMSFLQFRSSQKLKNEFEQYKIATSNSILVEIEKTFNKYSSTEIQKLVDTEISKHFYYEIRRYQAILYYINTIIYGYQQDGIFKSRQIQNQEISELSILLHQFISENDTDIHDALARIADNNLISRKGFPRFQFVQFLQHANNNGYIRSSSITIATNLAQKCGGDLYSSNSDA